MNAWDRLQNTFRHAWVFESVTCCLYTSLQISHCISPREPTGGRLPRLPCEALFSLLSWASVRSLPPPPSLEIGGGTCITTPTERGVQITIIQSKACWKEYLKATEEGREREGNKAGKAARQTKQNHMEISLLTPLRNYFCSLPLALCPKRHLSTVIALMCLYMLVLTRNSDVNKPLNICYTMIMTKCKRKFYLCLWPIRHPNAPSHGKKWVTHISACLVCDPVPWQRCLDWRRLAAFLDEV